MVGASGLKHPRHPKYCILYRKVFTCLWCFLAERRELSFLPFTPAQKQCPVNNIELLTGNLGMCPLNLKEIVFEVMLVMLVFKDCLNISYCRKDFLNF